VKRAEATGRVYDRFRNRIMFPITDGSGRVIAFSGRRFGEPRHGVEEAKYVNSPETPLFSKSRILFGYDRAKLAIRRAGHAVVVEGQVDLLMAHQVGTENAVALSGTALSAEHVSLLARLAPSVVLALDPDAAGIVAAGRSARVALAHGLEVKVAALPAGSDPGDLMREDPGAWRATLERATHIVPFFLAVLRRAHGDDRRAYRRAAGEAVLPFIAAMRGAIEQAHFVEMVAQALAVSDRAVWDDLARVEPFSDRGDAFSDAPATGASLAGGGETSGSAAGNDRRAALERAAFSLWHWQARAPSPLLDAAAFSRSLGEIIGAERFEELCAAAESEVEARLFEAETRYGACDFGALAREAGDLLAGLRAERARAEYAARIEDLRAAEASGDAARAASLMAECVELSRALAACGSSRVPETSCAPPAVASGGER
jgi:DNA primase